MEEYRKLIDPILERYEVSNLGNVRSLDFVDKLGRTRKGKVLKGTLDKGGYLRIRPSKDSVSKSFRIHRLVAEAFIPNPENKLQVNHIDGNKLNNECANLEWNTNSENQIYAIKNGLKITKTGKDAAMYKSSVSVYENGILIDTLYGNKDMKEKGYDYRNISACVLGKRKTYKGYTYKRNEEI